MEHVDIAIIGAGIGGMAAAIALHREGCKVGIYEQAARFGRVGAGINLTPNAVRALDGLGVGEGLRETAYEPTCRVSRMWDTGAETSRLELHADGRRRYGAPQLTVHRADLLTALETALPQDSVHLGSKVVSVAQDAARAYVDLADGTRVSAGAVIGCDGIHSVVRAALAGPEAPRFTGKVAFRAIVPTAPLARYDLTPTTKWWGPDSSSQIFTFLINRGRELFVFATVAEEEWTRESWSMQGSKEELLRAYAGFHEEARAILSQCDVVLKTALYIRDPMPRWTEGRITLLGDACHAMLPFMAQGAAMGLEDAVVLSRCLAGQRGDMPGALLRYERARLERTARIQRGSLQNDWLRADTNADWVYGFDAWTEPLPEQAGA
ncbi:6-hydroxynicotinate 3-monooxygenase precursor [Pigmentiphaga humi]|uniref:6-hydroxynicotinate 3-monooxygenase n=1 Tax=Pigmentiphaga humi TaxID=2478468 RepID=A0A3P4AYV8_9BURK|nr:FAD-dependent monooxygenase [Pigmentiphaga humi]VCU69269.1 6-hydroxynicotinate 3-monooxygenase precursor [Pigmentiphaga humi]